MGGDGDAASSMADCPAVANWGNGEWRALHAFPSLAAAASGLMGKRRQGRGPRIEDRTMKKTGVVTGSF